MMPHKPDESAVHDLKRLLDVALKDAGPDLIERKKAAIGPYKDFFMDHMGASEVFPRQPSLSLEGCLLLQINSDKTKNIGKFGVDNLTNETLRSNLKYYLAADSFDLQNTHPSVKWYNTKVNALILRDGGLDYSLQSAQADEGSARKDVAERITDTVVARLYRNKPTINNNLLARGFLHNSLNQSLRYLSRFNSQQVENSLFTQIRLLSKRATKLKNKLHYICGANVPVRLCPTDPNLANLTPSGIIDQRLRPDVKPAIQMLGPLPWYIHAMKTFSEEALPARPEGGGIAGLAYELLSSKFMGDYNAELDRYLHRPKMPTWIRDHKDLAKRCDIKAITDIADVAVKSLLLYNANKDKHLLLTNGIGLTDNTPINTKRDL